MLPQSISPGNNPLPVLQIRQLSTGEISWYESGKGPLAIVLLHGISTRAEAWLKQFASTTLTQHYRLFAWNAPGYGASSPLVSPENFARDYAQVLNEWLNLLKLDSILLVGHSLGALIAAAYTAYYPRLVGGIVLADPAMGYGSQSIEQQQRIYQQRQQQMMHNDLQHYAEQRAPALLRAEATIDDLSLVKNMMKCLSPTAFLQAAWMLAHDNIHQYLNRVQVPIEIWCGNQDTITPPSSSMHLAAQYKSPFQSIPNAGHASYIDNPHYFNQLLLHFSQSVFEDDLLSTRRN